MNNKKLTYQILSIPFIWAMLIPIVFMHVTMFIYQAVAFRLYGINRIQLRSYINFDRGKLSYLNFIDKINCAYCTYANSVFAYTVEIGHRTEYFWCGIKHKNQPDNPAFFYQDKFAAYGNKEEYEEVLEKSGRK